MGLAKKQVGDIYRSGILHYTLIFCGGEHLKMIQEIIGRLLTGSFRLKDWVVSLTASLQVFLKGEAHTVYLFVPALPVIAFWFVDGYYLCQVRLFRRLYDKVRGKEGIPNSSIDTWPFHGAAGSVMQIAFSRSLLFYGQIFIVLPLLKSLLLHKAR
jgi:hypothetical protein